MTEPVTVLLVAGARPNFMKVAPVIEALRARPGLRPFLVHTGQHYDERMSELFFRQLGIPVPDVNLEVGSGSHAVQTAEIMRRVEPVLLDRKPGVVVVFGDVNSTIACGLVAVKLGIPLAHVEAGLRSFDRSMPEEINRVLTDAISDLLFCTEQSGVDNLLREGVPAARIDLVGNVMIDSLVKHRVAAERSPVLADLRLEPGRYVVVTMHRPANVDDGARLAAYVAMLREIGGEMPVVFPVHPRTRARLAALGVDTAEGAGPIRWTDPLGYLEFLKLLTHAAAVLTDSGGIQEETTILGVPCITMRDNTERPVTVSQGTNLLAGADPARVLEAFRRVRAGAVRRAGAPPGWDGRASVRIADRLAAFLAR